MKCLKIPHKYSVYSLLFLPLLLFISLFITSSSYAVSDLTYTVDSSNYSTSVDICNNASDVVCTPYHYLLLTLDESTISSYKDIRGVAFNFVIGLPGAQCSPSFKFFGSYILEPIDSSVNKVRYASASNYISGLSFRITLSENNPFSSGITPSGSLSITENGTYDLTNYAEAVVDVPTTGTVEIPGDYHNDLVNIRNAIIICSGVVLVLYFFYCIYRLLIKSTGGWGR